MKLKNSIAEYVPIKSDIVDETLAHYINNETGKKEMRIMFIRVKANTYYFGNKKIKIALHQPSLTPKFHQVINSPGS